MANVDQSTITLTKVNGVILAGNGVLLYGTPGTDVHFDVHVGEIDPDVTPIADMYGNCLQPTINADGSLRDMMTNIWVLGNGNEFVHYTGAALAPNSAYIQCDSQDPSEKLTIVFDNETSDLNIDFNASSREGKFIENGCIVIEKNGVKYNVNGQIVR